MLLHIVLFRAKAELEGQVVRSLVDAVSGAQQKIPAIRRFRVGRRVTHGRGYEQLMREDFPYAAVLEFDDLAGLQTYLHHPAHTALGDGLFEALDVGLIYDYDMHEAADANALLPDDGRGQNPA